LLAAFPLMKLAAAPTGRGPILAYLGPVCPALFSSFQIERRGDEINVPSDWRGTRLFCLVPVALPCAGWMGQRSRKVAAVIAGSALPRLVLWKGLRRDLAICVACTGCFSPSLLAFLAAAWRA